MEGAGSVRQTNPANSLALIFSCLFNDPVPYKAAIIDALDKKEFHEFIYIALQALLDPPSLWWREKQDYFIQKANTL